ncbi:phage major capsid protein [bacterium]|nr:phage major capsid protein [bacterium]
MPELTKEQIESLIKVNEELKVKVGEYDAVKADAIKKDEMEKLVTAVIDKMHPAEKKIVWSGEPKENEEKGTFQKFLRLIKYNPQAIKTVMSEGISADGGYLVPVEYSNQILGVLQNTETITGKCTTINMGSNSLKLPSWLTNISVYWIEEDATKTLTKFAFGQIPMLMKKCGCILPFTDELLDDNIVDLKSQAPLQVGKAIANKLANQILEGNANPFTGIKYNSTVNAVAQAAVNLAYNDLVNVAFNPNVKNDYDAGSEWILHKTDLKLILKLKDADDKPIWNIGSPLGGIPASILGYPYIITDQLTAGTILFGNLKNVLIGNPNKNAGVNVAISNSAVAPMTGALTQNAFLQDETWFRFIKRSAVNMVGEAFVKLTGVA